MKLCNSHTWTVSTLLEALYLLQKGTSPRKTLPMTISKTKSIKMRTKDFSSASETTERVSKHNAEQGSKENSKKTLLLMKVVTSLPVWASLTSSVMTVQANILIRWARNCVSPTKSHKGTFSAVMRALANRWSRNSTKKRDWGSFRPSTSKNWASQWLPKLRTN